MLRTGTDRPWADGTQHAQNIRRILFCMKWTKYLYVFNNELDD